MTNTLFSLVNKRGDYISLEDDPFNLLRKRTIKNTSNDEYNCGGYALETFNWFIPFFNGSSFDDATWEEFYNSFHKNDEEVNYNYLAEDDNNYCELKKEFFKEIQKEYSFSKKIDKEKESIILETANEIFYNRCYDHPIALTIATTFMLSAFPKLRQIKSFRELKKGEYGIAYAAGNGDFHFCKYSNGIFTHKIGDCKIEEVKSYEEAFFPRYDSEVIFFAMKIRSNKK